MGRRVRRNRKGQFEIRLAEPERELLRSLGPQMREVINDEDDDAAVARLFPVAYRDDPDRENEFRLLARDELRSSHLAALATLEESAGAERLEEEQLLAWMRAINDVRLVLGTRLDVTEEGNERPTDVTDPRAPAFAVYDFLTWLQGEIVDALSP
jgi:Domain of unknown function (DUF2017)